MPIGRTSTPRPGGYQTWGHTERGPTRNPWHPELSPGGSSAGSAAAVAAGIVELATGSDGAGSVRIPAAWCAVIGYKPTRALAPVDDPTGLAVPGVLVRDPAWLPRWAAAVLDPLPTSPPVTSAAFSADLGYADDHLDPAVVDVAYRAARELAARAGLAWRDRAVALTDPRHAWNARRDPRAGAAARRTATAVTDTNLSVLAAMFDDVDVLMTPTTPAGPHGHDGPGEHLSVSLTWALNLTGHPACSVPAGFTDDGVPVGLQLVVRPRADAALLELCATHVPSAASAPVHQIPPEQMSRP